MAIEDSGPVAALRRELDEARRAAGDASAEGARLRGRLTAVERERDEQRQRAEEAELTVETWLATERDAMDEALATAERERDEARAVRIAACAALGANATGDLAADVEAQARALDFARKKAGWRLDKIEALGIERDEARAVIAAACTALGASATGDLAADVARVVREREEHARDADTAEATLRETTIALERVRGEHDAEIAGRLVLRQRYGARPDETFGGFVARLAGDDSGRARIEPPPVEAAAESPHRVGDTWRHEDGREVASSYVNHGGVFVTLPGAAGGGPAWLTERGWRRVRCAPAVGDAVRVGDAVGVVARLPEAPLQGVRVDGPGDRMTIAEAGDLEMAVHGET